MHGFMNGCMRLVMQGVLALLYKEIICDISFFLNVLFLMLMVGCLGSKSAT